MCKNRKYPLFIIAYLVMESAFLVTVKMFENVLENSVTNCIKYTAILLNTIVTMYYYLKYGRTRRDKHENLIAWGLFTTVVADFFLTLIDTKETLFPGFLIFCVVETIYAVYLNSGKLSIIVRAIIYAALIAVAYMLGQLTVNNAVGLLNIALIWVNAVSAWLSKRAKCSMLFKVGIVLFVGCDTSILVRGLTNGNARSVFSFLIWFFYIPSQVLITMAYANGLGLKREKAA